MMPPNAADDRCCAPAGCFHPCPRNGARLARHCRRPRSMTVSQIGARRRPTAAWASGQALNQADGEMAPDCGNRVWVMPLGTHGRRRGVSSSAAAQAGWLGSAAPGGKDTVR
jgi:hypothetical protein